MPGIFTGGSCNQRAIRFRVELMAEGGAGARPSLRHPACLHLWKELVIGGLIGTNLSFLYSSNFIVNFISFLFFFIIFVIFVAIIE